MKLVTAIVKPHRVEEVKDALREIGVSGLTQTDVEGFGRQRGHTEVYRGAEYKVDFVPKVKVEIVVGDDDVQGVIDAVLKAFLPGGIRVTDEEEAVGLDLSLHSEAGYALERV